MRWRVITALVASTILALSAVTPARAAEPTKADVAQLFLDLSRDRAAVRAFAREYLTLLPKAHQELYVDYYVRALTNPAFGGRVYDLLAPRGSSLAGTDWKALGLEMGLALQLKGMQRLPLDRQVEYVRYAAGLAKWLQQLSPIACRRYYFDDLSRDDQGKVEVAYLGHLPLAEAKAILDLHALALEAEIAQAPVPRAYSAAEAEGAEKLYRLLFDAKLKAQPDRATLLATAADIESAPAADACRFIILTVDALTEIKGPPGEWAVRDFVASLE